MRLNLQELRQGWCFLVWGTLSPCQSSGPWMCHKQAGYECKLGCAWQTIESMYNMCCDFGGYFYRKSAYYTRVNTVLIFKSILCLALLQQLIFPSCYITFSGYFFRVHSIRVHVLYHPSLFNVLWIEIIISNKNIFDQLLYKICLYIFKTLIYDLNTLLVFVVYIF